VTTLRKVAIVLGFVIGAFFIIRAVVELVTIDYSDPSSYANDWGGPSLGGVLLVHCGLGLVSAVAIGMYARRRRRRPED
jgi:hypothetical protein